MKIRSKIALVFTLLTAVVLLLLSSFIYFLTLSHVHNNFFTRLKVRASMAAESHFEDAHGELLSEIRGRHLQTLPQEKEIFVDVNDDRFNEELASKLPGVPKSFSEEVVNSGFSEYFNGFRHYSGIRYESGGSRHIVVAIAYDENGAEQMSFLAQVLIIGFSVSCLLVFFIGRLFATQIMTPISQIIDKVKTITASDLGQRLPNRRGKDEIAEMAGTFNNMLDRLETAFELQSNFISNASHEVRTPLTSILGESEVILKSPRSQDEYIASIKVIQHEASRLEEMTSSLLRLSQISFDGKKQKIEPVMMDELLMSIKISLDKRMPDNHARILIQQDDNHPEIFSLMCVRVWMELAITNIIQNAIKYSDNKEVLVTLNTDGKHFIIQVSDYGIGIPSEELPHILEPFFRGSNTSRYTGYGIGLPLTARIVRLHGGTMDVVSKEASGTHVTLKFPCLTDIKIR